LRLLFILDWFAARLCEDAWPKFVDQKQKISRSVPENVRRHSAFVRGRYYIYNRFFGSTVYENASQLRVMNAVGRKPVTVRVASRRPEQATMTKILVIEDEEPILENVQEILSLENYEIRAASNGEQGLDIAFEFLPDLIICDIMMPPGINGYDVLMEIRNHAETSLIPFIFLTARTTRADMRRGMDLGADDYLTKPFSAPDLLHAIQARLGKQETISEIHHKQMDILRSNIIHAMPHEFRTPLNGILGYASLMMDDPKSLAADDVLKMSERIYTSGMRLKHLIENYLLYAQIEIMTLQEETLDAIRGNQLDVPAQVVEQAARRRAAEVNRNDDVRINAQNALVAVSDESLAKIVEEIVDNGLKFSMPGNPVNIQAGADGTLYRIQITDSGRGMTAEQMAAVGAYMQFDRKVYEQQGMGLGLILSKRIAELYGGSLETLSEKDRGTQVTITLPLVA